MQIAIKTTKHKNITFEKLVFNTTKAKQKGIVDSKKTDIYHKILSYLLRKYRWELFNNFDTFHIIHNGYGHFKAVIFQNGKEYKQEYIFRILKPLFEQENMIKIEI